MNSPEKATHPTLGLGAKFGADVVCELAGGDAAARRRTAAKLTPARGETIDRIPPMTAPPLAVAVRTAVVVATFATTAPTASTTAFLVRLIVAVDAAVIAISAAAAALR